MILLNNKRIKERENCALICSTGSELYDRYVEKAKAGLLAGQTVSEVSQALGFDYPQHFTRMFKREFGIVPSALRNSAGPQ